MPRDVEPAVADLPGVALIGMDRLSERRTDAGADEVAAVRAICEAELAAYQSAVDAARVAPTVVALRAKAATVVDAELARLAGRLSGDGLSVRALDEIAQTMRRVAVTRAATDQTTDQTTGDQTTDQEDTVSGR